MSDTLKKRIEALNKKPLEHVPPECGTDPEIEALRRKLRKVSAKGFPETTGRQPLARPFRPGPQTGPTQHWRSCLSEPGPPVTFEEVVDARIVDAPLGPGCYIIEKPAGEIAPEAAGIHTEFLRLTGNAGGCAVKSIAALCKAERIAPAEVLFLDLETTGLSSSPVFLIGTMECGADGFCFRQYFARDYSQEISILTAFAQRSKTLRLLITFNGKSFDWPFLQNRGIAHAVKLRNPSFHLDLLHEARRCVGRGLPNCKLQTLESRICGRTRIDDIPGAEIPEAYHAFVRTGNANKISLIIDHNLYDLLTMAHLMRHMWR